MRIASVEVLGVGAEHASQHTLVRLTTDSGITGLGQSACWGYPLGVAGVLGELSPLLIGADPFRIEHLWHLTYRARPFRGNLLSAAVSAIDLALWDIKGKALDLPVWELLGGRSRDRVRLHVLVGGGNPDEIVSSVNWAVAEGFTAIKFDPLEHGYEDLSIEKLVNSTCSMASSIRCSSRTRSRSTRSTPRPRSPSASLRLSRWASGSARSGSSTNCSRATSRSSRDRTSGSPAASPDVARSPRSPKHTTVA